MSFLEVRDLHVNYGMIRAIRGVSFHVEQGEIVSLIGANGAGKTTVMHALCNLIGKASGQVFFEGREITHTAPHKLVPLGIAQVPEGRRIFSELSVADNLRMGAYTRKNKAQIAETLETVYARFPVLKERAKQIAGTLSGGEQQMLAMSRALMSQPRLLLLDEPSMGLSPLYVNTIFDMIQTVNREGTTVLLVEQNAKKALEISNRTYVLETGVITKEGTGAALMADDAIRRAYLGE